MFERRHKSLSRRGLNFMANRRFPLALVSIWAVILVILVSISLNLTNNHFLYILDDPYIHLALADSIFQGGYGINFGEYASPSSSILYPFLLVLTKALSMGVWGPFILNTLATSFSVYLIGAMIQHYFLTNQAYFISCKKLILGLILCILINSWGLVFTGLEHSIQVMLVIFIFYELANYIVEKEKFSLGFAVALVLLPLIRFEGLAFSLLTVFAVFLLGQRRMAVLVLFSIIMCFALWFECMQRLGLPWFPSSVLVKSNAATNLFDGSGFIRFMALIIDNIRQTFCFPQGKVLISSMIVLCIMTFIRWKEGLKKESLLIGGLALLTGLSHLFFGKYGCFLRYEAYVVTLIILANLFLLRGYLIEKNKQWLILLVLFLMSAPSIIMLLAIPSASEGIYDQQYQLQRFVKEYLNKPVAVNDLGLMSYQNPNYVLDLYGLGSEETRKLNHDKNTDPVQYAEIALRKHVHLIIIYDSWFKGGIPKQWVKVAEFHTPTITASEASVSFYATPLANIPRLKAQLKEFSSTLPSTVVLQIK